MTPDTKTYKSNPKAAIFQRMIVAGFEPMTFGVLEVNTQSKVGQVSQPD